MFYSIRSGISAGGRIDISSGEARVLAIGICLPGI
jgi:hypothetical protein